jgi:hypothetical protein
VAMPARRLPKAHSVNASFVLNVRLWPVSAFDKVWRFEPTQMVASADCGQLWG